MTERDVVEDLCDAANRGLPVSSQLLRRAVKEIERLRVELGALRGTTPEVRRLREVIEQSAQLAEKYGTPEARHIADELRDLRMVHPVHRWDMP